MGKNVKILLSYHKPDYLFKDNILTPIHAGRDNAMKKMDEDDPKLKWLLENTTGDNTGDNISSKNALYNEMTTVYWAWKNYEDLGNPDYIGFMHYRRHFVFDDTLLKANYECADIGENYYEQIGYSEEKIYDLVETCDFITVKPLYRKSMYEHYEKNHHINDLETAVEILKEKFPEYSDAADKYLNGSDAYFCNMYIFPRDTFFRYAEWFYDITFELEKRVDMEGKRLFVSEWLTGIFITKLLEEGKKGRFFPTIIAEGEHEIPIVLAGDNNYAFPMLVTIASLLQTAHKNTTYNFNLLVSGDFSDVNKERIERVCQEYKKYKLNFIDMGSAYSDAYIKIAHISTATYYRLKLPSILPDINKCIYLDVDLIARKDLSEMFRINVDDNYIAGVKAAGYYQTKEQMEKKKVQLGIEAIDSYVNAGVLIMNLAKMRKDGIEENFEKALENKWPSQDQDVLNAICYGKIRIIHMKYNAMTKYELDNDNAYKNIKYLKRVYSKGEWDSGRKNPTIIHFCDKTKPWTSVQAVYSYLWWDVVRHLPDDISLAIYDRYMDEIIRKATVLNKEVKHERSKKLGIQKKCDLLLEENKVLKSNIVKLKKQNQQTKKSITFRIGSIFTFIPHKLKRLFKK